MSFQLNSVVPWGRTFEEYRNMFLLGEAELSGKIAGFGDGPASFNMEATQMGYKVTSFDPVYQFTGEQLAARIEEARDEVMEQMAQNQAHYIWTDIHDLKELEERRMSAMKKFLADYPAGTAEKRYICHELPQRLPYPDKFFDLGLSSHFLLMYTQLGYDFHIQAIQEMLRVCQEVRIFPLLSLNGESSELTEQVAEHFRKTNTVEIRTTPYEFQKGGNRLMVIH